VPNVDPLNLIKQAVLYFKAKIEPITMTVGDFNILLSPTDRSSRQKKKNQQRNFKIK
jgi:hypothetical protein